MKGRATLLFIILLLTSYVQAQLTITSTIPSSNQLTICEDSATFSFKVNADAGPATSVSLTITMPAGMEYVSGSLNNTVPASKQVSFSSSVGRVLTLSAQDMILGDSLVFSIDATAGCSTYDLFLTAAELRDTVLVSYNGGSSDQHNTASFNNAIAHAQISINQPAAPTGSVGSTVSRTVQINNTDDGCLTSFDWYDAYGTDITVDSIYLSGTKLNTTTNGDTLFFTFTSSQFTAIGNNDGEFCNGESITITEYISLNGCSDKESDIRVNWGCGGSECDSYSTTGDVVNAVELPNLTFTWYDAEMPACFHEQVNRKGLIIKNIGTGMAREVQVQIKKYYYGGQYAAFKYDGLDTATVQLKENAGAFAPVSPYLIEMNNDYSSCSQDYAYRFYVATPDISVGDSVTIEFDMINCAPDACDGSSIQQGAIGYNYWYKTPCLNSTINVNNQPASSAFTLAFSGTDFDPPSIGDGATASFTKTIQSMTNNYPGSGRYVIEYVLPPCGIDSAINSSKLEWKNTSGTIVWNPNTFTQVGDTITAHYNVSSMPSGFVLAGSEFSLELTGACGCSSPYVRDLIRKFKYTPEISCTTPIEIDLACDTLNLSLDPCNTVPCDGARINEFTFVRSNYGEFDDDLNRQPDGIPADPDSIRLDRIRLGDTITSVVKAAVGGSTSYSHGYVEMTNDLGSYFTPIGGSVRIYDSNNTLYIDCDTVAIYRLSSTEFKINFTPDSMAAKCGTLSGYTINPGDTIWVTTQFKLTSTPSGNLPIGTVSPVELYLKHTPGGTEFSCGTAPFSAIFQIVNMVDATSVNTVISNSCGQSIARTYINMFTGGSYTDMFPSEYRNWSFPDTLEVTPPANYEFVEAYVFLRFSPYIVSYNPVPVDANANPLVFDIRDQIVNGGWVLPDDGYEMQFFTTWQPTCASADGADVYATVDAKMSWAAGLESLDTPKSWSPAVRHNAPELEITNIGPTQQDGIGNDVSWQIRLQNTATASSANNVFLAFDAPSEMINLISVVDDATSLELTAVGGIYQLGTFGSTAYKEYTISANYNLCEIDTLVAYAGWDCSGYPADLDSYPCETEKAEFKLRVDPKPAAAQLTIDSSPSNPVNICDTLTYQLSISSTLVANVQNLTLDVIHSGGAITAVGDSSKIEYPNASGYVSVSDPTPITGGFRYDLASLNADLDTVGLEGIMAADANKRTVNVEVQLVTDCNFISGDVIYFQINGTEPCDDPIPPILRISEPLEVGAVVEPYSTTIGLQIDDMTGCTNSGQVDVAIFPTGGTVGAGDTVLVTIPDGINFDNGSFTGVNNAPTNTVPVQTDLGTLGTELRWEMPSGVASGDSIKFNFTISVENTTGCSEEGNVIKVNTLFATSVTCGGTNCNNYSAATGTQTGYVKLEKPDLILQNFTGLKRPDGGNVVFEVSGEAFNAGTPISVGETTTIECFCDSDSDQTFTGADSYVGAVSQNVSIPTFGTFSFSTSFTVPPTTCALTDQLFAVVRNSPLPAAGPDQCLCDNSTDLLVSRMVLPLELVALSVKLKQQNPLVTWVTVNEINTESFEIQRSQDGILFQTVGKMPAGGNTVDQRQYQFKDMGTESYQGGVVFYRIKVIDHDGALSYTRIESVMLPTSHFPTLQVYPNPTRSELNVYFSVPENEEAFLTVTDGVGRQIQERDLTFLSSGKLVLDTRDWAIGIYYVQLNSEGKKITLKVSKM